jgi:nitrogen fixation-related uncharacterized protein
MLIYIIGAFGITLITAGLFAWALLTKHFQEDKNLKHKPLEEDEEI